MIASAVPVPAGVKAVLIGADFADAFAVEFAGSTSSLEVARRALGTAPRWVTWLMDLRGRLMAPFGLKTRASDHAKGTPTLGFFPVISATPQRTVLGLDDRHLDFRLVIDTEALPNGGTRAVLSTVIRRHNIWGRLYLLAVLPFHKVIVPTMLRRGAPHTVQEPIIS